MGNGHPPRSAFGTPPQGGTVDGPAKPVPWRPLGHAAVLRKLDPAIVAAFGCIVLLLLVGSLYSSSFLSGDYLLQQLKVASFLGVIATGAMIVILLGQIDLSVPWVVAVGGMMSTAAVAWGPLGQALAIPFGVACGVALGLVNGAGVAYLRLPSMVVTLAVNAVAQGLMVVHTGGFSPQDASSPAMRFIATGHSLFGIPNALLVWGVIAAAAVFLLTRTTFGRTVYAIGNRERAAYLSGARTRAVVLASFAIAGGLSAFGGVLLAGYASKAAQAMGDPYLLPAIAAVVLGGTSILGGRGNYLGTVAGVILITLLQSILSVMQIEEYGRHVIYGGVIIGMLLIYGRGRRPTD
jgi:ribose transport system permease protein